MSAAYEFITGWVVLLGFFKLLLLTFIGRVLKEFFMAL